MAAGGPDFILILTLVTPNAHTPDIVQRFPMETREECMAQANDFTVHGFTKHVREEGIVGVIGACFSRKVDDEDKT